MRRAEIPVQRLLPLIGFGAAGKIEAVGSSRYAGYFDSSGLQDARRARLFYLQKRKIVDDRPDRGAGR